MDNLKNFNENMGKPNEAEHHGIILIYDHQNRTDIQ